MTAPIPRAFSALLGLSALLLACGSKPDPGKAATRPKAPATAASTAAPALASASAAGQVPSVLPACRAVRVLGAAQVGGAPLTSGALLTGSDWVTLRSGASVALKHSTSARELAIQGPALFRACWKGREQVLLVEGTITTTAGAGARPGAEVLIATPAAVVRYADAELVLTLDRKQLKLEVRAGQAEVEPVAFGKPPKGTFRAGPVTAKEKLTLPLGKPKPEELVARCQEAAEAAEASARRVGDPSAPEPLGERAQAHVRARKAARTACTVAAAATGLVADSVASAGLWAEVLRWEGLWETIPRPRSAVPPEK